MSDIRSHQQNNFYLKNEFITWLKDDQKYTSGSANSYASYVSMANKAILIDCLKGDFFFELIREAVDQSDKTKIEVLIDQLIAVVIMNGSAVVVNKYKNGLIQYRNFLMQTLSEDEIINDTESETVPPAKLKKESGAVILRNIEFPYVLTYDRDALKKIFIFRMVTQDRCYGDVYFIISFLKKLFYKDKASRIFFDDYIENQINNIQLHTSNGTITLADIKALTIEANSHHEAIVILILNDNSRSILYTKQGTGDTKMPMNTFALKHIAIDHIFPMKMILEEQEAALPTMKRITQTFRSFQVIKANEKIKRKMIKDIGNQLLSRLDFNLNDIEQLKGEMTHIQSFIELQLMDGAENLLKKAKFERSEEKKSPII